MADREGPRMPGDLRHAAERPESWHLPGLLRDAAAMIDHLQPQRPVENLDAAEREAARAVIAALAPLADNRRSAVLRAVLWCDVEGDVYDALEMFA